MSGITRDKTYDLTKGTKGTKTLYLTANPNSESEIVSMQLSDKAPARVKQFDFDFAELAIKGKGSMGNIVTKQPIKKITQKAWVTPRWAGARCSSTAWWAASTTPATAATWALSTPTKRAAGGVQGRQRTS